MEHFCRSKSIVRILISILSIFSTQVYANKPLLTNFDFHKEYPSPCHDSHHTCHTVNSLTAHALENGYDTRESAEFLFQARQGALERLGKILPHINLGSSFAIAGRSILDFASSFVGFLFPSRHLEWQAKRRKADAELESLKTLFANTGNAVQSLVMVIHSQIWNIRIMQHYIDEMSRLIEHLIQQRDHQGREVSSSSLGFLYNMRAKLQYDLAYQDRLSALYPELAQAVGIKIKLSENEFALQPEKVGSLRHFSPLHEANLVEKALARSTEIIGLIYMIKAAELDKKSNYFEFIDPDGNNDLGFGYGRRIKISRSTIRIFQIHKERTTAKIALNIFQAVNNYNDALVGCNAIEEGLEHLEDMRLELEAHVQRTDVPFDISPTMRYFDFASGAAIRFTTSYFIFKMASGSIDRYTWEGDLYRIVEDALQKHVDKHEQRPRETRSWLYRLFHPKKKSASPVSTIAMGGEN